MRTDVSSSLPSRGTLRVRRVQPTHHPRVLLLTSGLGYGHVRAAQAVEAALLQRAATVRMLDLWSLMNPGAASIIQKTYLRLVQEYPALYERLYHLDEHTWRHVFQSEEGPPPHVLEVLELISEILFSCAADARGSTYPSDRLLLSLLGIALPYDRESLAGMGIRARLALIKWTWLRLNRRIGGFVQQFAPDAVISTQMIPAAMVSSLKRRGRLRAPLISVLTDYGMHDFWRQPSVDCYCIAHESVAIGAQVRGAPKEVRATGVPLMPGFAHPLSQAEARLQLKIAAQAKVVLVLGGGLGLSVDAIAAQLLQKAGDTFLIVMPGKNSSARSQLLARAAQHPGRMQVCDWTERMDVYMRAADVVVGKPGGVSVAEALACGRPLFATRSLGGQEGFNVRFLEENRVGGLVADVELAARIDALMQQPGELTRMQERAWALGSRDGAAHISDLALDLAWTHRPHALVREN